MPNIHFSARTLKEALNPAVFTMMNLRTGKKISREKNQLFVE
jgi:hypothetical protein